MKPLTIKFSYLIASAKFQRAMGTFHHSTVMCNYQALHSSVLARSILGMVYYLSALHNVWSKRVVALILVVFESRYHTVGRHFCGGFPDRNGNEWGNNFFFGWSTGCDVIVTTRGMC